jgi:hypothetical protein
MIGEPVGLPGTVKGTATIHTSLSSSEVPQDGTQFLLTGRPKDMFLLAGTLPVDPRRFLPDSFALTPVVANRHTAWRTQPLPGTVPLLVPLQEECYATPPVQSPGQFGDLVLCRRSSTAYVSEQTTWEGDQPYPASSSIATRMAVNSVDDYARSPQWYRHRRCFYIQRCGTHRSRRPHQGMRRNTVSFARTGSYWQMATSPLAQCPRRLAASRVAGSRTHHKVCLRKTCLLPVSSPAAHRSRHHRTKTRNRHSPSGWTERRWLKLSITRSFSRDIELP